jgi:hypothetical protein
MKQINLLLALNLLMTLSISAQNTFPATGNVGIGTLTPVYPLDIQSNTNGTVAVVFTNPSTGPLARTRYVLSNGANNAIFNLNGSTYATDPNSLTISSPYGGGGALIFASGGPERMRITTSGYIGIGTTSPLTPFDVKIGTNQHIQFVSAVNGHYSGAPGIVSLNDANNGYTPLGFFASNYYFGGGNVGIGTTDTKGYTFAVNGKAIATDLTVKLYGNWPDYVFKPAYHLLPLNEVKSYIDKNDHLPDVPSEQEVKKDGLDLGEMNELLLKKVEELTLYLIEKDKELKTQSTLINEQQKLNKDQQQQIDELKKQMAAMMQLLNKKG